MLVSSILCVLSLTACGNRSNTPKCVDKDAQEEVAKIAIREGAKGFRQQLKEEYKNNELLDETMGLVIQTIPLKFNFLTHNKTLSLTLKNTQTHKSLI